MKTVVPAHPVSLTHGTRHRHTTVATPAKCRFSGMYMHIVTSFQPHTTPPLFLDVVRNVVAFHTKSPCHPK